MFHCKRPNSSIQVHVHVYAPWWSNVPAAHRAIAASDCVYNLYGKPQKRAASTGEGLRVENM